MSLREEQCKKVCRILDNVLANRPTERDSLIVAVRKAFESLEQFGNSEPLPSAQPEKRTEERMETHACDLIDREAAVDAIYHHLPSVSRTRARTMLHEVPSAQPEIIRCKDCKHHWTHKCMDSMPIERCDLGQTFYDAEVDFCSLAERREVTT